MTQGTLGFILRHFNKLAETRAAGDLSDAELLERVRRRRVESAFAILLPRHGPMVLAVCRRILDNLHDAEDAFQATFLVLVRKAGSIRKCDSLASWLYGVAQRVAVKARARTARRRSQEGRAAAMPHQEQSNDMTWQDLRPILDEELAGLPEKYRAPLVLCCLESKTQEQAAAELGCPRTSLASRIARARHLLRERLARRGVIIPAGLLATALAHETAQAAVPALLTIATVRAALRISSGHAPAGAVSTQTFMLADGVVKAMSATRWKLGAALLALAALMGGSGLGAYQLLAPQAPPAQDAGAPEPAQRSRASRTASAERQARLDRYGDPLPPGALARLGTLRFRHGGLTATVAFAADGKSLLTLGADGLRIWETATGKPLHRLANQEDRHLDYGILSPDGRQVLTMEMNRKHQVLRLWEVASGRPLREFGDHHCMSGCFSADGKMLATFGTPQPGDPRFSAFVNVISLWDLATGQRLNAWSGHEKGVYCGLFTGDGKTLITGGDDKAIRFWDVATGKQVRQLDGPRPGVGHLVLSPNGRLLAVIGLRTSEHPPGGMLFPSGLGWHADNSIRILDL